MQKWSSKSESTWKTEQDKSCWKFFDWSKSTVNNMVKINGQRLTCADVAVWHHLRAYVAICEAEQARGSMWETLTVRGARAREAETSGGACDVFSGRSWLGFAWDWLFYLSMPFLWQLNKQNVDIRVLQVLWAWRWWLASDSDYWMKARAAEERRRCPQEPESQRNGSDTMLTI